MKKIIVSLVIVALMLGLVETVGAFSGDGSGTEVDPYIITDPCQLQEMQYGLSAWYELGNDIDASATSGWNGGEGFVPVGDSAHGFTGHLDGNDFTISGLYVNRGSDDYVGLFGVIDGGEVKNVGLVDPNVTGKSQAGALVGKNYYGTITNCHSTGDVSGTDTVGGLVGFQSYGSISHSSSQATVIGSGDNCGGLLGNSQFGTIDNCNSAGNVRGNSNVGGLAGSKTYDSISNCNSEATVIGSGNNCGGLVGFNSRVAITNCRSAGAVTGDNQVGGLVGYGVTSCTITNCHSTGNVTGNSNVGGLVGYMYSNSSINDSYATGDVNGYGSVAGLVGYNRRCTITHCYSTGTVNATYNAGGLVGYHYDNSSISVCFSTSDVNGTGDDCGGLVGLSTCSITDCFATGNVSGNRFIGGLVGDNTDIATTTNCYSTGSVSGTYDVGGFAGWNSGTCNDCFWDVNTSGLIASACGTPKTTVEMMLQATFDPPWNFSTIWGIEEGQTYPFLMALSPTCGDPWHPYPIGDLNYDCRTNFLDFAAMTRHWLECTDPECD
jgi:hypothetical protein